MLDEYATVAPAGFLAGKVIIVTGASQGIGLVSALGFARAGARVALGARRAEAVAAAATRINAAGGEAIGLALDVTREDSVAAFIEQTVARFGKLDGLFNNAGRDPVEHGGLADISLAEWKAIHDVKIDGTFLCSKHAIPHMLRNGRGSIVNNGSCVADRAPSRYPAPSSSQAAIVGMTRSMAAAYGHANIRTNMLATGLILTAERVQGYYKGMEEQMRSIAPMCRAGTSEEVAQAAAWLLSDYAGYVNGATIAVDGGYIAGNYQPG
ncbi:MAG: SDR family NAD(P)-dependent oxidoreductase [Gammaproteobacteria bacterium]